MQDQVWWVTGASSGSGAALARGLAARGAKLILSGRNVAALEAVAKDIGAGTMILPFEATDYDALPRMVEEAWNWCGRSEEHTSELQSLMRSSYAVFCLKKIK